VTPRRFQLPDNQSRNRVDKVLAELLNDVSRTTIRRWIEESRVRVNGVVCRPRDLVGPGALIDVEPGPPPPTEASAESDVVFRLVYEDPFLVVIDKPPGLVVHPARGHGSGTLVNGLLAREGFRLLTPDPRDSTGLMRPGIVHRIDKDTSGLLVVAKDEKTREGLKEQLANHSVERSYRAITVGVPRSCTISTLHGRHPKARLRFSSFVKEGRQAVTHVKVLESLATGRAALVECRLSTGRTHQIRVHLSEQTRTPILADALYGTNSGDPLVTEATNAIRRQALHAASLGFIHPITSEYLVFESPLPEDFLRALTILRG
jgi:23S rRNA pseudouridine1911/1915/1917 synthase